MRTDTTRDYRERILRVLVHIQEHLDESLPLDELAALACFSPYHFHRIFRGMVGEPLHQHVRRLRLERGAMRLRNSSLSVTEIAFEAGYDSHEAFTRAFTAAFGVSPSGYRESHRSLPSSPGRSGVHYTPDGRVGEFIPHTTGGEKMDVRVERIEPMRVAFMRHTGPYDRVGETWGKLYAFAGRRGYFPPRTTFLGLAHDDPEVTDGQKLRYDACFVVDGRFQPQGDVGVQEIAGGDYAVTTHRGPYDTLSETYGRLCGEWAPAQGREIRSAPAYEIYLSDPRRTRPEDLLTEIHLPLE